MNIKKLLRQLMFFLVFSVSVTLLQFLILRFLPGLLGEEMAAEEAMWPDPPLEFDFLGSHVRWCLLGCEVMRDASGRAVIGGGLGAAIAGWAAPFAAQCVNFPLQRNITFKSHGDIRYQIFWYFIAWVLISLVSGGVSNLIKPVVTDRFGLGAFSLVQTFLIGTVSMVVMFFVFRIIFPEGKAERTGDGKQE